MSFNFFTGIKVDFENGGNTIIFDSYSNDNVALWKEIKKWLHRNGFELSKDLRVITSEYYPGIKWKLQTSKHYRGKIVFYRVFD